MTTEYTFIRYEPVICCKIYSDLTEQEEAKLFANQSGFGVPPSIGMKLRALVFAGDPEAVSFLKANEEIGLRIDYGQHKGRKRVACIAASLTEFRKLGPEKYQMAFIIHEGDIIAKAQASQENVVDPYRIESAKEEHTMDNKQAAQPTFSRVMIKGIPYYRTRIKDADGKRVSLYARTEKELVVKLAMARGVIEDAKFRKLN